jgi:hypothetical protein
MIALRLWTKLVHELRDEAGRPLGEHRASEPAPMELATCVYPDSRSTAGKPINVSALREMMRHWRAAMRMLACVRRDVVVANAMDVWWAGQIAESLPYQLLFRNSTNVIVPGPAATLYKAMLGTNAGLLGYVLERSPSDSALPTVDAIMKHVNEHGLLVGPEQACAGPEALIRETLSVLIDGGDAGDEALPDAVELGRARASLLVARAAFSFTAQAMYADVCDAAASEAANRDQQRFAMSTPAERSERLHQLLQRAENGEELMRACERALATASGDPGEALQRQQEFEERVREWIAETKQRIVRLLPRDPERDRMLALTTAAVPMQTPLRRLESTLNASR